MLKQLLLATMIFAAPAFACQEDVAKIPGLSDQERVVLVEKCETAKTQTVEKVKETTTKVVEAVKEVEPKEVANQAVSIATQAAAVVKEVSAELSIAVNDFIKTPVGVLAATVAIWYYAGDEVYAVLSAFWDIIGGITLILVAAIIGNKCRSSMLSNGIEQREYKNFLGNTQTKEVETFMTVRDLSEDAKVMYTFIWVGQALITAIGFVWVF